MNKCINGYLTQGVIPNSSAPNGPYPGAAVIGVTG
jgi:hypothetical protein